MDRISRLPDEILLNILTFLPTKHAVATSILSHRWSSLWTSLPVIDLYTHEDDRTPHFVNFVDNFVTVNNSPIISEFRLKAKYFDRNYLSSINRWIQFLISRNVVEFDLQIIFSGDVNKDKVCLRFSPCESLEVLKLDSNFGLDMPISACCFPNLRILHLSVLDNRLYQELLAKLFPNLPVLEELCLTVTTSPWERISKEKRFNIVAPALKTFSMSIHYLSVYNTRNAKIVIDAPLLEKICLKDDFISFYSFNNRPCLLEAQVSFGDRMGVKYFENGYFDAPINISRSMELLWAVSNSKSLSLSGNAVLALVYFPQNNLPAFPFLTKLELFMSYVSAWKMLLPLLANAPNLRVLVITVRECVVNTSYHLDEESMVAYLIEDFQFCPPEVLPTCLLLHLEEIEIRGAEKKEEFKELEYIVENAKVLKKLTVNSVGSSEWCPAK